MALPVSSNNSQSSNLNSVNKLIKEVNGSKVTQVFKDRTGTNRVLLGSGADDFYGLKVSKSGVDVYGASDDQLVFNSEQNVFKIVSTGSTSITLPASPNDSYSVTVAHGLSTVPAVIAYVDDGTSSTRVQMPYYMLSLGTPNEVKAAFFFLVDDTNITFIITTNYSFIANNTYTFRYYTLQETAS